MPDTIHVLLTNQRPLTIIAEQWETLAHVRNWVGQYEFQAYHTWWVKVRQHTDGHLLVQGRDTLTTIDHRPDRNAGGLLVHPTNDEELIAAIHDVCEEIGHPEMAQLVIEDLPPVDFP